MNERTAAMLTRHGFSIVDGRKMLVRQFKVGSRTIELKPFFNKAGDLSSLQILDSKRKRVTTLNSGLDLHEQLKHIPVLCLPTVIDVVAEAFGLQFAEKEPQYLIAPRCDTCGQRYKSFISIKSAHMCSKCIII